MILSERVTMFGQTISNPAFTVFPSPDENQDSSKAMKVDGRLTLGIEKTLRQMYEETNDGEVGQIDKARTGTSSGSKTKVWLVHKIKGELVTETDPVGRPSMIQRLIRGGVGRVGKTKMHLKPVGRLDMQTEGLMVITNDGQYARELELPANHIHRIYKARVHGRLTPGKMQAIRKGLTIQINENVEGGPPRLGRRMNYKGMRVSIEKRKGKATNTWLQIVSPFDFSCLSCTFLVPSFALTSIIELSLARINRNVLYSNVQRARIGRFVGCLTTWAWTSLA